LERILKGPLAFVTTLEIVYEGGIRITKVIAANTDNSVEFDPTMA
jgi:hypothetical protein